MRCLIAGYNLVGALQGRAQNIAPLQVGGIVAIDAIEDGLWGMWAWWDGGEKKSASPKKKSLRGKKVGFAEKKLRLPLF